MMENITNVVEGRALRTRPLDRPETELKAKKRYGDDSDVALALMSARKKHKTSLLAGVFGPTSSISPSSDDPGHGDAMVDISSLSRRIRRALKESRSKVCAY